MSFLAPFFLLGGLAVGLPVVFHLVRRSSREKMVFSSLTFLRPTPPRMTRRNQVEHVVLLLLRCLVICILSLGFARPFFRKPLAALPQGTGVARAVVLVDTSASMKREGLWSAALAKANGVLNSALPADQVAVLAFDDQVRSVVSFEQWAAMGIAERPSLAAQRLADIKPTWRSTHLGNALIAAADALQDADKRELHAGPKRIVLITDLQEGARLDSLQGYEWPRGVEVVVERIKAEHPTNAGLQWVSDADDSAQNAREIGARIRVSNSADAKREQFQIRWDGVVAAPTLDAYVPPGQSRIMPAPKLPTAALGERIVLSGDDDDFDNAVYLVQPKPEKVSVLFLGDDSPQDPAQLLYYLKRAFQDTRRQSVRINTLSSARSVSLSPSDGERAGVRGSFSINRLVIISGNVPENHVVAARQFFNEGGTVLFVMNDAGSAKTLSQLAAAPDLETTEATVANYSMFSQMDFEHPLLAPFADQRFSDFTKIRVWKHRRLPLDKLANARVVARFDDNDPAIVEIPVSKGRLFVLTFSWRPVDSQLALSSKFVPLLYSLLDQADGVKTELAQFRVGEAVDLSALTANSGASMKIRKPDGSQVQLASGEKRFLETDRPGIYEINTLPAPLRFAVNLDPAESKTSPLPQDEFERLGVPMKSPSVVLASTAKQEQTLHNADLESRQKLWRWLIASALAVLLFETWLAGRLTRRAAGTVEVTA